MWHYYQSGRPIFDVVAEVKSWIENELRLGYRVKICVGTDSQVKGDATEFATVIVMIRKGEGGRMLISKQKLKNFNSIRERLMKEVVFSIETAYNLQQMLTAFSIPLEVHADINADPMHASQQSLSEAKGYILGMGYTFKGKPDAFASSSCANKVVQ